MNLDANFTAALKEVWPEWRVKEQVFTQRPFLAMVNKFENAVGSSLENLADVANPQNVSADFATAKAGTSSALLKKFQVTRKKMYGFGLLDNETLEASKNDMGAKLRYGEKNVRGTLNALANQLSQAAFRDGTGAIGIHASESGSGPTTVTLATKEDIVNFEIGMQVAAWASGGSPRAATGVITAVNRQAGTFTCAEDLSTWTANDLIAVKGNKDSVITGLQGWIPVGSGRATALAASFYGVTRNIDAERLGGCYIDGTTSGGSIEEMIIDGANEASLIGGGLFDYAFMNPIDMSNLIKTLGSKVQRVQVSQEIREGGKSMATVGFSGIEIFFDQGSIKVLGDRSAPKGFVNLLQMDTWTLASIGPMARIFDGDSLAYLRADSSDGLEYRAYSYSNLLTDAPGKNAIIKIA
jgi:hypothetical protein